MTRAVGRRREAGRARAGRMTGLAALLLPALSVAAAPSGGQERPVPAASVRFPDDTRTFFVGVLAGRRSLDGGDLDGTQIVFRDDEQVLIPALEPAPVIGLVLEARSGAWVLGLGYARAVHRWSWRGQAQDPARATSSLAHLEVRRHLLTRGVLQPFLQAGFVHGRLGVEAGRTDTASDTSHEAGFAGWGAAWGGGVDLYPSAALRLTVGVRGHHCFHDRLASGPLPRSVSSAGLDVYLAASRRVWAQAFGR